RAPSAARTALAGAPSLLVADPAVTLRHDLALVDPDLHADAPEGRLRLDEAVVDVRANGGQRNTSFGGRLGAAHLGAAQAAAALNADALRPRANARCERALHRA